MPTVTATQPSSHKFDASLFTTGSSYAFRVGVTAADGNVTYSDWSPMLTMVAGGSGGVERINGLTDDVYITSPTGAISVEASETAGEVAIDVQWPTEPFGVSATNRAPGEVLVRWQEPIPRRLNYFVEYEVAQPPAAPSLSSLTVTSDGLVGNVTSGTDADDIEIQYSTDGSNFTN
jgi:hypothetical protein